MEDLLSVLPLFFSSEAEVLQQPWVLLLPQYSIVSKIQEDCWGAPRFQEEEGSRWFLHNLSTAC